MSRIRECINGFYGFPRSSLEGGSEEDALRSVGPPYFANFDLHHVTLRNTTNLESFFEFKSDR